jgi:N-acyl-D-aspartate/D-glutamate deacylase
LDIDAAGLAVTPGFIDIHSHSDYTLLVDPRAMSAVAQGVTTEVIGNCGFGCAPIGDPRIAATAIYGFDSNVSLSWHSVGEYFAKLQSVCPAVNVIALVPNGQLRLATVGLVDRAAGHDEIEEMRARLREGLADGAAGFSIGLEYPAEIGCARPELLALAGETARASGLFATHTRNRAQGAPAAVQEVLGIASESGVQLQVSHLMPRSGDEECRRCLDAVEEAHARGQSVNFDMHTRLYGTTMLSTLLPPWCLEGGVAGLRRNLASTAARARIKSFGSLIASLRDWERVQLLDIPGRPDISRRTLAYIGGQLGRDPHDCALDILAEEADSLHRTMVLLHAYGANAQKLAFTHPLCVPGSDATTLSPNGPLSGSVFHGAYSWASWFWRMLVREWKLLRPEQAVNRLTGAPASILGLSDRGTIRVGYHADIAVFAPEEFADSATTFQPNQLARGMQHVFVNGVPAMLNGTRTPNASGSVLKRHGPSTYE